jgi:group I intron endonuclease
MVIYKIINMITKKVYIGQTVRNNPNERIRAHFKKARHVDLVYESSKKYGKDVFTSEVIYIAFDLDELNRAERYFISYYNSLVPNGYNIQLGGNGAGKLSTETKKKMSRNIRKWYQENKHPFKGKSFSKSHKEALSRVRKGFDSTARRKGRERWIEKKKMKIISINIKTKKETEFNSIKECADSLGLQGCNISRVLAGKTNRTQHKGYTFRYKERENNQLPLPKDRKLKYITSVNKGGYSVVIRGKYIGWRKTLEDAMEIRDTYLKKLDNIPEEE